MITRTRIRRIATDVGAPLIAAGVLIGGMVAGGTAIAGAQPNDTGNAPCSMSMTSGKDIPSPNGMTRAGQVAAASGGSSPDYSMSAPCPASANG